MNAHVGRIESGEKVLRLAGRAFVADPSGALFCPEERLLLVADLHLEKGSSYAARRVFLPPYDTAATLARLAAVIARLAPKRVIALGDSFHDGSAAARLMPHDVQALRAMQVGREWLWVAGNHDPAPPAALDGDHAVEWVLGPLTLRHEPSATPGTAEIAGHLHPVAVVGGAGAAVRRRCFVADATRCVMPAFGAYAGGLNLLDRAFAQLFGEAEPFAHVLGRSAVFSVGRRQCLVDRSVVESWR
ncbi:hypothetical protein RHAL1_03035 [Beijerinckiaceae bacterium RH AL1]|nr:ligase-associated DNA damage response endonuclease PdeM [Beijerinckiaceae bacterium]VVB47874.1 hypothetical protein RHCH11_RHCH11_02972 [Beijerinckiaceae bacterium RH CH11]VVB47952.1 hypothetical protein RHAL8_02968 [Beijerinckiaceae bacterium RH AL8]VVC56109.1 hypothetical protein RHAL1_03035 [Beijerinckiaceae bacterium RH AL1]